MISKDKKILIVGLGLLGGSYAKGLSEAGYHVIGIARRQETIDYALANHLIQEGSIHVEELTKKADIVIFGLYPETMITWMKENQSHFKANALITDVSGVKCNIVDTVQDMLRDDLEFISAHPMAGKESSGIEFANTEMFKNANYIITPTSKNSEEAIAFSYDLANLLGFHHISELSCEKHDQ